MDYYGISDCAGVPGCDQGRLVSDGPGTEKGSGGTGNTGDTVYTGMAGFPEDALKGCCYGTAGNPG